MFFADGSSARPIPAGTVARDHLRLDTGFFTGRDASGKLLDKIPVEVTKQLLARGQERFNIYCTPCHGQLGDGQGMIARRGLTLKRPIASYHTDRLRAMPIGHYYEVMTKGFGAMYSYASRVEPQDRWAIAAYIRVLQFSQNAPESAATKEQQDLLEGRVKKDAPKAEGGEEGHE